VRVYRVVGIYDALEKDGRIIREERDGFRLLVDLTSLGTDGVADDRPAA
jgi:hypothetical protein